VAAASKLQAEFGGDDSAAAVGWITGNADLHEYSDASRGASPATSPKISSLDSRDGWGMQKGGVGPILKVEHSES
jgi:hypothetical protein